MSRAWAPLLSACVAVGCLPPDSRPTPGSVFVSAQPSEATRGGFSTADGWQVRFETFLTALGDVDLDDPDADGVREVDGQLWEFLGLAGARFLLGLPLLYAFVRPTLPVAAVLVLATPATAPQFDASPESSSVAH